MVGVVVGAVGNFVVAAVAPVSGADDGGSVGVGFAVVLLSCGEWGGQCWCACVIGGVSGDHGVDVVENDDGDRVVLLDL